LATELLQELESQIDSLTIVPSEGGRFEVTVNDKLLFSKLQLGRHANSGEVLGVVKKYLKETV
jgi:selenoprotein W-related protein